MFEMALMIPDGRLLDAAAILVIGTLWLGDGATAQPASKFDMRSVWHEPTGASTPACEGRDDNVRRQLTCVATIMKTSAATPNAVQFMRHFSTQLGEVCYLSKLQQFGSVSLATIDLPFRRNTNAHTDAEYAIVNGTPAFIRVDDNKALQSALARSPAWLRLQRKHPNIDIWEGTTFTGAHALPGGSSRLVFSYPLGEYHAEAGRWNASVAFDFAPGGTFVGRKLLGIDSARR